MKFFLISLIILLNIQIALTNENEEKKILILGDSLTAGYGIDQQDAFPAVLERKIHESGYKNYRVINAGVSGSTSASGKSRLNWFLKSKPNILILILGANDGLRGLKLEESKQNLDEIIQMAKNQGIVVVLGGMLLPVNYGQEYRSQFQEMYESLHKKHNLVFIPFVLKDVGGVKDLNIADGIHPNTKGHQIVANTVFHYLRPLL